MSPLNDNYIFACENECYILLNAFIPIKFQTIVKRNSYFSIYLVSKIPIRETLMCKTIKKFCFEVTNSILMCYSSLSLYSLEHYTN